MPIYRIRLSGKINRHKPFQILYQRKIQHRVLYENLTGGITDIETNVSLPHEVIMDLTMPNIQVYEPVTAGMWRYIGSIKTKD